MKKIALMMLVAFAAFACQKPAQEASEITVTTTDFTIPLAGTEDMSFKVEFNAPEAWTAAIKETQEWCSIAPSSGAAGAASVTVIALENEAEEERTVTLVITSGTAVKELVLTQEAVFVPRLTASAPAYIPLAGGTTTVEVTTNVEYTATLDPEATWLTMTQEGNVLTFTAATANDAFAARTATVTFATDYEGVGATVAVSQEGRAAKLWTKKVAELADFDANKRVRLAAWNDKLLLSNGTQVYVLNPETGALESTIPMPTGVVADNLIVDDAGNLLIGTDMPSSAAVALYYVADPMNPAPELVFTYAGDYYAAQSGNIRVKGNIKDDAMITAVASDGAGGAVLYWEVVDGVCSAYSWTTPPYTAWSVGSLCAAPVGTTLADGIFYIGYGGDYNLRYAANVVKSGTTEWAVSYVTGSSWQENYNCISTAEWKGHKYAAITAGCHFNYDDADAILLNVDNPAAATLVYTYSGTPDVERSETWANLWWNAADAQTGFPNSDILVSPTTDALVMVYVDAAYGAMSCVAVR